MSSEPTPGSSWSTVRRNVGSLLLRRSSTTLRRRSAPVDSPRTTPRNIEPTQATPQSSQRLHRRLTTITAAANQTDKVLDVQPVQQVAEEPLNDKVLDVQPVQQVAEEPLNDTITHEYDDVQDNNENDEGLTSLKKLAAFRLIDGIGRTTLACFTNYPCTTLVRNGVTKCWKINASGIYTFDPTLWEWNYNIIRDIGITGLYAGVRWTVYEAVTCTVIDWAVTWLPRTCNITLSSTTKRCLTMALSVLPQLYCQWRYVTEMTSETPLNTDNSGGSGGSSGTLTLSNMFQIVPWWMIGTQFVSNLLTEPNAMILNVCCDIHAIKYYLPLSHPLRETRTWSACFSATSWFNVLYRVCSSDWLPLPNYQWSTLWHFTLKSFFLDSTVGVCVGTVLMWPIRTLYYWGINNVLEDKEHRLARKLQIAANQESRGFVSMFGMDVEEEEEEEEEEEKREEKKRQEEKKAQTTSRLLRTSTIVLKRRAVSTGDHTTKHNALIHRQIEHADICALKQLSNGKMYEKLIVARSNMEDSLCLLAHSSVLPLKLGRVQIVYSGEEGIDAGGLLRDWIETVAQGLATPKNNKEEKQHQPLSSLGCTKLHRLMEPGPDAGLLPVSCPVTESKGDQNGTNDPVRRWREQMFGIGRLMGLSVTTGTPLPLQLSRTLYKVILGEAITSYDLKRIDPQFYKNRVELILEEEGVQKMESILYDELYFVGMPKNEEEAEEGTGEELIAGGKTIRVTEANKHKYLTLFVEHYLIGHARQGVSLIVEGFKDVVPKSVLRGVHSMQQSRLSALDLELIVSGLPDINVDDWKLHTRGNIVSEENKQLRQWFWEIVDGMSVESRTKLLSYCCGSSRLPASGFVGLKPHLFNIAVSGESTNNLPSAHTCFNQLQLPKYSSKEVMQEKLNRAINECEGFGYA